MPQNEDRCFARHAADVAVEKLVGDCVADNNQLPTRETTDDLNQIHGQQWTLRLPTNSHKRDPDGVSMRDSDTPTRRAHNHSIQTPIAIPHFAPTRRRYSDHLPSSSTPDRSQNLSLPAGSNQASVCDSRSPRGTEARRLTDDARSSRSRPVAPIRCEDRA